MGTANFVDPFIWKKLPAGLTGYLRRHGLAGLTDVIGSLELPARNAPCG